MWFHIDPSSGTPIYRQIVDQVKQAVAGGVLQPGQRLPATRDLAVELAINPNTVVKAYQVLELEGVIELPRGRGAFIANTPRRALDERGALLEAAVERLVAEAFRIGCGDGEVLLSVERALAKSHDRRAMAGKERGVDGD